MRAAVAVAAVAAVLLGAFTWAGTLFNGDEATYALFARALREGGDWWHLRLGGEILHQRPPLYPWLLALSTSAFGETIFALRLPSLLAGAATAGVVVLVARRLVTPGLAVAAGLLHPTLALAFRYGRAVVSDAVLTFFCAAAIQCWWDATERRRAAVWAGVWLGAALMTKQVVGLLPVLVPLVQLVVGAGDRRIIVKRAGLVAGVAALIAGPWHAVMIARHGQEFLGGYIGFNVLRRTAQAILPPTRWSYYLEVLWAQEGVILGFMAVGMIGCLALWARSREARWLLVPAWVVAVLLPFTVASSRIDYYLVPAMPALAVAAVVPLAWIGRLGALGGGAVVLTSAALHVPQRITEVWRHPEIAAIAEAARGGDGPLVVVDDLPFSPEFYARRRVLLVVTGRAQWERVREIDLFRVPGNLRYVPVERIGELLAGIEGPYTVLEAKRSLERHGLLSGTRLLATGKGYVLWGKAGVEPRAR